MIPTWSKVTLGFMFGVGVGTLGTYFFCKAFYEDKINADMESVRKNLKDYYENKKSQKKTDIPKEEPEEKPESYAADATAYSSLDKMYVKAATEPRQYNKRKNEEVGLDKPKLTTIHAISYEEFLDNDDGGKVSLTYFSKDKTLTDEYGETLWKDGKNVDPECHFEWFGEFVTGLIDDDHIYILDPNKNTVYQISKVNSRRSDWYMEEED